jgi:dihydrofolate synthase/folylpolyglutamate synthase
MTGSPSTTYQAAIEALFARTGGQIKPGLERTEALLAELGDPHRQFPSFHIAGTNGKGSTCATLDALLRFKGLKVGRYTSPHLVDFRERILVNGVAISEAEVLALLERLRPISDRLNATFFEITTALAFTYFAEQRVDIAVIETGLGGRLDSTNVITPLVATVTNIGLDHTEYLGDTLQEIADEKGGIFKFGRPAVIAEPRLDLARRLADIAAHRGATPIQVTRSDWRAWSISLSVRGTTFMAETPYGQMRLTTPLYGEHQARNTVGALAALDAAGEPYRLPVKEWNAALSAVRLPGRFQRTGEWIFDVAHNPAGIRVLTETLELVKPPQPVTALLGVLGDKEWRGMVDLLAPMIDTLIITQPASAPPGRAWDPMEAALYASQRKGGLQVVLEVDFDTALLRAQAMAGTKIVTGSFHTVGDAMARLGIDPLGAV